MFMRFLISSSLVEILSDSCVFHQKLFAVIAQPVQHLRKNKRRYEADKNVTVLRSLLSVSTLDFLPRWKSSAHAGSLRDFIWKHEAIPFIGILFPKTGFFKLFPRPPLNFQVSANPQHSHLTKLDLFSKMYNSRFTVFLPKLLQNDLTDFHEHFSAHSVTYSSSSFYPYPNFFFINMRAATEYQKHAPIKHQQLLRKSCHEPSIVERRALLWVTLS